MCVCVHSPCDPAPRPHESIGFFSVRDGEWKMVEQVAGEGPRNKRDGLRAAV